MREYFVRSNRSKTMHVCRPGPRRTQQGHRQIIMGDHRDQSVRKGNTAQKNQPGDTSLATRGADGSGGLAAGRRESDNNFDHHQAAAFCTKKTGDDDVAESSSSGLANSNATDIEVLRAENAFLRLALEEAQHKLRLVGGNAGQSSSSSVVPTSREPGNGGVAYARMRRLLLKDDGFLRDSFLPFLNVEDLGRCSGVCRRFKKAAYDVDVIIRCIESGGITDATRGLMWLIMVGMDPAEASSRGVLGVVAWKHPESPEEQYDRLHRAMNGTIAPASPMKGSRHGSVASFPVGSAAPTPRSGGDVPDDDSDVNSDEKEPAADEGGDALGKLPPVASPGVIISESESGGDGNNSGSGGRGAGSSTGTATGGFDVGEEDASVGVSLGGDASVGGDASLGGGDSVLLWEESADKGVMAGTFSLTQQLEAAPPSDEERMAIAAAAAEAAEDAFAAEAAAGIRPLGGRSSLLLAEAQNASAEAAEASDDADSAGEGGDAVGGGAGDQPPVPPPAAEKPASSAATVVGWASGLFRRTSSTMVPVTPASAETATGSSPAPAENATAAPRVSLHHRRATVGSMDTVSPEQSSSKISRGLLFGLRYARYSAPKSALPVDTSSASANDSRFFGEGVGKERRVSLNAGALRDGEDDGWPALERVPGLYAALLNSADAMDANDITGVRGPKQSCFVDIEKDVKRTLGMDDITALRNVLRCTSTFVTNVGYVQGMNFVCRCLLQVYDDEEEAFWVFVGMLQRFGLQRLYCPGMPLLRLRFFQLNRLLMWHLPELFAHFEACGVTADLFATSWFVTLLSDGGMLPDDEVKVMWDRIFLHSTSPTSQWAPIFLVLLELLRRAEDTLKQESRFSELIHTLVNMPFRDLCKGRSACSMIADGERHFETSSPMPVQLLLLHDQWMEGGGEEGNFVEYGDDKQLL